MFRRVEFPIAIPGRLYLHSMPGRYENLALSLAEIARLEITRVVGLTPLEELIAKSPEFAENVQQDRGGWLYLNYPIPDYGVPENLQSFVNFVIRTADYLRMGNNVLIHCGAGIGRTGIFAISILISLGFSERQAEELVKSSGSYPETEEQRSTIAQVAQVFHRK